MTYDQYWIDEPSILIIFAKVYKQKERKRLYELDLVSWMNGYYTYLGFAEVLSKAFSKRSSSSSRYPTKPMFGFDNNHKETEEEKVSKEVEQSHANFLAAVLVNTAHLNRPPS